MSQAFKESSKYGTSSPSNPVCYLHRIGLLVVILNGYIFANVLNIFASVEVIGVPVTK